MYRSTLSYVPYGTSQAHVPGLHCRSPAQQARLWLAYVVQANRLAGGPSWPHPTRGGGHGHAMGRGGPKERLPWPMYPAAKGSAATLHYRTGTGAKRPVPVRSLCGWTPRCRPSTTLKTGATRTRYLLLSVPHFCSINAPGGNTIGICVSVSAWLVQSLDASDGWRSGSADCW